MKRKIITFLEGICVTGLLLSMSAMDSPDVTIPTITMFVSLAGFMILTRIEQKNSTASTDQS